MMTSQERVFKVNEVIWTTKSRVIHVRISLPEQYQMIMYQWLELNLTLEIYQDGKKRKSGDHK